MRPAHELLERVRELTKICIIHSAAGRGGGESNERAMDDDAKDKALALGVLNASEIEDVFHVPRREVGANATFEEVATALKSAQPLDQETRNMANKWIDGKCNALAGMLEAPLDASVEDVWRGDRLNEVCHLAKMALLADEAINVKLV